MTKKLSFATLCMMAMVALVLLSSKAQMAEAACNPTELSPCVAAITSSVPPSSTCCGKLRQQRACLCGYIKDPNLSGYVNSPNARKVAATCGVPYPKC